jgi:hypothetical protein
MYYTGRVKCGYNFMVKENLMLNVAELNVVTTNNS